jgi:hypothetical protein
MKMINKPFYHALHYPALMPFQKEDAIVPQTKIPNIHINQEVFDRLYGHAMVDNHSKQAIRALHNQPGGNVISLNQQTGHIEVDPRLQNQLTEIYGDSRKGSAKEQAVSAKLKHREAAKDASLLKSRHGAMSNIGPRIKTRSRRD